MGNTQSYDPRHIRIWNNLSGLEDDASRLKMLDILFASPEHVAAAKSAGVYSALLQWVSAVRHGTYAQWPAQQPREQPREQTRGMPRQTQQLARIPPPKRALDTLYEAYRVLELDDTKPLTHEALRQAYRKAGFKTHPDRGGSAEAFDEVTRAFEYLQQVLEKLSPKTSSSGSDPRFTAPVNAETALAARGGAGIQSKSYPNPAPPGTMRLEGTVAKDGPPIALNPKKLDMNVFNKLFEENRLPDPDKDDGYGDWLKSQESTGMANNALRGKYNKDMFNKTFEEEARRVPTTTAVAKYAPPAEIVLAPHMGAELGGGRPQQYTNPTGGPGTAYTDLKHAYGEGATFSQEVATVDTSGRPQTFEQAKREYGSAPSPMSAQELAAAAAFDAAKKQAEEARQRRAAAHDVDALSQHERLQRRLMIKQ